MEGGCSHTIYTQYMHNTNPQTICKVHLVNLQFSLDPTVVMAVVTCAYTGGGGGGAALTRVRAEDPGRTYPPDNLMAV